MNYMGIDHHKQYSVGLNMIVYTLSPTFSLNLS